MLDVGLVEDGALGPTGLHQVVDGPVPGHEASLGSFGLRSVGETSLSSSAQRRRYGKINEK